MGVVPDWNYTHKFRYYDMNEPTISLTNLPSALPFTFGISSFMIRPLSFAVGASIPSSESTPEIMALISWHPSF